MRPIHALTLTLAIGLTGFIWADALPIVLDGHFDDWAATSALHTDPSGDQGSGTVDFGELWVANDDDRLYLRIDVGPELTLDENNSVMLYVDSDNTAGTGLSVGGIGAEFSWDFGNRSGTAYNPGGSTAGSDNWLEFGLTVEPVVSSSEFEIAFDRAGVVSGVTLFQGSTIALLFQNEDGGVQDRLPNVAQTVTYTFDATSVTEPSPTPMGRISADHVRVMSLNALGDTNQSEPAVYNRIITAVDADVFCFQEMYTTTAGDAITLVSGALGGTWYSAKNNDTIIVSRHPILTTQNLDGNLGALIDLPSATYLTDLYVIDIHLPCCTDDAGRQDEVDNIIAWIRDLRTAGGVEDLAAGTPIVVTGDTNFVGLSQQLTTLLTGDIQDEFTFGTDFAPDWDASSMVDALPIHTSDRNAYTWRNDSGTFSPGRIDYLVYTDSVLSLGRRYVLWTPSMSASDLTAAGLLSTDSTDASDHIPVVVDLIVPLAAPPTITGLAIVRADALLGGGNSYTVQGTVTSVGLSGGRNQFNVQDATGAIVVDDPSNSFAASAGGSPAEGDEVMVSGTTTSYSGLGELTPIAASPNAIVSSGNSLPEVQILPSLASVTDSIQAELVGVKSVQITAGGTDPSNWQSGTNYTLSDGANTLTFRIGTGTIGWASTPRPANGVVFDIVGTVNAFGGSDQIHARSHHPGDGTVLWNGTADSGPDAVASDSIPVELSVFTSH